MPWPSLTDYRARFKALVVVMGRRFLITSALIEHVFQGFLFGGGTDGVVGAPLQFMLRSYGTLTATDIQILKTIAVSPWALKPLFGMLSDTVFISGYNKLPYIIATTVGAALACLVLAFIAPLSPVGITLLLFLLFLQMALADLLIEAKYTEKMVGNEGVGPDLQTFINLGLVLWQLLANVLCGVMITYMPLNYIYLVPIPFLLFTLYPVYQNWLDDTEYHFVERRLPAVAGEYVERARVESNALTNLCCGAFAYQGEEEREVPLFGMDTSKVRTHWRVFLLCGIIGGTSLFTSLVGLLGLPTLYLFIVSLVCAAAMIGGLFALMPVRMIALVQTYNILNSMCSISTSSADFFFFTDTPEQYPEGPHFSYFFYVTVMGLVATILSLVGIVLYNLFMTRWRFRTVLRFSSLMLILFTLPNIMFVNRWNVWLGIPDAVFVLGAEALQVVTGTWASMPIGLMMLQLCPKDIEATGYAILAGSSNMGRALSQYFGAYLLEVFAIRPTGAPGESHQFDNMWKITLISVLLPLIPLLLINWLIPDKSQTDSLLGVETVES
jgi:MFS family permease